MAKCIMVQGTMSNAGKSLLCAGLCRIFHQDGYRVAPFKSQNMALNSFITRSRMEMGRAQVMQAEAACTEPDVRMNPLLLKPTGDKGSQVILNGEVLGDYPAAEYFKIKKGFWPQILKAYDSLAAENDIIVLEGAGSPAEINLKKDDIVNMGLAEKVNAPVLLVGDIDRGGVFAQLYGTTALLPPDEKARVKGLIINKFRGDVEILRPGLNQLEELCHIPVLGVVPYLRLDIEDEDSLSPRLEQKTKHSEIDIAVIRLPHISNFTDFDPLDLYPGCGVRYVSRPAELGSPDLVILPGTKNTLQDLLWLRSCGLEAVLKKQSAETPILGICGGYQMMGRTVSDPEGAEGPAGQELRGMELLPCDTVFARQKHRTRVHGRMRMEQGPWSFLNGSSFDGYEIHMGRTLSKAPLCELSPLFEEGETHLDGSVSGNAAGCYVHGLFESTEITAALVTLLRRRKGLPDEPAADFDYHAHKQRQYDLLADALRAGLDMKAIYKILEDSGR